MKKKNAAIAAIISAVTGSAVILTSLTVFQKCKKAKKRCVKNKKEKKTPLKEMIMWTVLSGLIRALSKLLADQLEKKAGSKK